MFRIHCPRHGADILLGPRRITAIHNSPSGVEVHWRCYCGTTGVLRPREESPARHVSTPPQAA
jgi:hypothetical protein